MANPRDNGSAFNVHVNFNKWNHDLNAARSPLFDTWVSSNLLSAPAGSAGVPVTPSANSAMAPPASLVKPPAMMATGAVKASKRSSAEKAAVPASCSGAGAAVFQVSHIFLGCQRPLHM